MERHSSKAAHVYIQESSQLRVNIAACGPFLVSSRRKISHSRGLSIVAEERKGPLNPFGKGKSPKEEEARKALQGLFHGKKDVLSAYDVSPDTGGGGGGRGGKRGLGGDDSGGSGWQRPDWRRSILHLWNRLFRSFRTLLAVFGFIGIILLIPTIPKILATILTLVKMTLRLDGRARSLPKESGIDPFNLAGTNNLGRYEVSVIKKYGNADS